MPAPSATALGDTERQIQTAANLRIRVLQAQHDAAATPLAAQLVQARARFDEVEAPEFERLVAKTGRHQEDVSIGPFGRYALLFLLSIGEAAFNATVFAVFGDMTIMVWLMALAVAVAIPMLAHGMGVILRQWQPVRRKALSAAAVTGIAIAALVADNWFATTIGYFTINLVVFAAAVQDTTRTRRVCKKRGANMTSTSRDVPVRLTPSARTSAESSGTARQGRVRQEIGDSLVFSS